MNQKHLNILKQGLTSWNEWRKNEPQILPNLKGAQLTSHDLVDFLLDNVNFQKANLAGAELAVSSFVNADFTDANLVGVDFGYSNLYGAKLVNCHLGGAEFENASLQNANLRGARCISSVFRGTDLRGVNFEDATFNYTILADSDLTGAKGLESINHVTYSLIDHRTLANSGELPISFLRGCGLPDGLIAYLPSLLKDPLQFYSCFISYSSKDSLFAERLYADLQNKGVRCWFAPNDLKIGDKIRVKIDESIRVHDKLLVVLSKNSIKSEWVEKEVETAMERERQLKRTILFPIQLDNEAMEIQTGWCADIRRTRHIGDFRKWSEPQDYNRGLERLLRDLKTQ